MEQVVIQDCGCIALPESAAAALDLRRGTVLNVELTASGDGVVLMPYRAGVAAGASSQSVSAARCVMLPPSR